MRYTVTIFKSTTLHAFTQLQPLEGAPGQPAHVLRRAAARCSRRVESNGGLPLRDASSAPAPGVPEPLPARAEDAADATGRADSRAVHAVAVSAAIASVVQSERSRSSGISWRSLRRL